MATMDITVMSEITPELSFGIIAYDNEKVLAVRVYHDKEDTVFSKDGHLGLPYVEDILQELVTQYGITSVSVRSFMSLHREECCCEDKNATAFSRAYCKGLTLTQELQPGVVCNCKDRGCIKV